MLVWPEGDFGLDRDRFREVTSRFGGRRIPWAFSATDVSEEGSERSAYNAVFLGGDGVVEATYRKRRLVAFGEYVPLVRWLPFMKYLTPIGEGFAAGSEPVRFEVGNPTVRAVASPVICFEDTFPHGVRDHAGAGVDFLLELTNDGWFGTSSAQWQHLANVVFRAVENDVALVRCANNGISCWVDALGLVRPRVLDALQLRLVDGRQRRHRAARAALRTCAAAARSSAAQKCAQGWPTAARHRRPTTPR
jgi:apolipoprotein N-acyltransferase